MPVIDLRGPDGNAFYLMGMVRGWARQLDIDPAPIIKDMRSGDYHHLLDAMEAGFPYLDITFINDPRDPSTMEDDDDDEDGTSGQDRESYTDDQDRESYT